MKSAILSLALMGSLVPAHAEDLVSVYQQALTSDPQYAAARAQFAATIEKIPQAYANLLPSLSLSGNNTINVNQSSSALSDGRYNSHAYAVNLTQPIFRRQNQIAHDQSKLLVEQARAQLELARQDLIVRVGQAYFDVLLAQDTVANLQAQLKSIAEQASSARRKFDVGTGTVTDLRDTQAREKVVSAQLISAEVDVEAKREALRSLIGKSPGALAALRPGVVPALPQPARADAWVEAAENQSMPVVAGQAALDIARLEVKRAAAAHYPTLDLTASRGHSRSSTISTIGTSLSNSTIGVQLALPLYAGGGTVAAEREMAALLNKAEADLDGARRNGALTARQAYLSVTAGVAQIRALEEALDAARTALEANKRGLDVGVRINVDVLNAQQQLSLTERDLARSHYDTLLALLKLRRAAGQLAESDLEDMRRILLMH